MGNNNHKNNKFLKFSVQFTKICYLPGENIEGTIILEGHPGLTETQLTNPKVFFLIIEKHFYQYQKKRESLNITMTEELHRTIYQNYIIFNQFLNANLLSTVKIPFSIKLPLSIYPSCSFFDGGHVKHTLSIVIEHLKVKEAYEIVIKNNPNFTAQNQLLKIPCIFTGEKSKSKLLVNKGNFKLIFTMPKNLYYYDEPIPFEIK